MKITIGKLKELIREAFGTRTTYIPTGEDIAKKKSDLKYNAKPEEWRDKSAQLFDSEVDELSNTPEFESIEAFVQYKYDDEALEFTTTDLRALVASLLKQNPQGISQKEVKSELESYDLKFVPREPVKHVRGFGSPVHGSNRYAGNAAGSGIEQGGLIGMGGGQGAVGGGKRWDPSSGRDLPMGSRRR